MRRALVVDDSKAMRMILSRTLAGSGFVVFQAAGGKDALEFVERDGGSLDVVMVDWNMPEMTGLEFVRAVRAQPKFKALKLVMVTTETEIEQMTRALEAGADEYLMKPFTPEAVQDKLRLLGLGE